MRLVIQRVKHAEVTIKETNNVVGKVDNGLFVLVGIKNGDTKSDVERLAEKLIKLRVLADEEGMMNKSVVDAHASLLIVSQFTLYADTSGGNRPSFINAAKPADAIQLYEHFVQILRDIGIHVETGEFGSYMEITAELDGPVTIILES
jgi:D-aminoacyl-tRNA deacylase